MQDTEEVTKIFARGLTGLARPAKPFLALAVTVFVVCALKTASFAENSKPAITSSAVFTRLYSFCSMSNCTDGNGPQGSLVQGLDGNFYGVTAYGGIKNSTFCPYGCGTFFKVTPAGVLNTLYRFCSQANCADGSIPATLILGDDGNFYGTTLGGGTTNSNNCSMGCGTILRITRNGVLSTLYSFDQDGGFAPSQILRGKDGTFYGAAWMLSFQQPYGQAFTINPQGVMTVTAQGQEALQVSFLTGNGSVYGVGMPTCNQYCTAEGGWVSKTAPDGTSTILFNFCPSETNCTYSGPGSLLRGADGYLYGTVGDTGGLVYRLSEGGTFTPVYNFCSLPKCADGSGPGGLIQGTDGNFYGETGASPNTLFQLTPGGALTTLYTFCAQNGCGFLPTGMMQATDGNFYGMTYEGGDQGSGIVYSLSTGLGPFVRALPAEAAIGRQVRILGADLRGTTAVSFNGVPTTFVVNSKTYLTATVPVGATTGKVTVTTDKGTLSSDVVFQVAQ